MSFECSIINTFEDRRKDASYHKALNLWMHGLSNRYEDFKSSTAECLRKVLNWLFLAHTYQWKGPDAAWSSLSLSFFLLVVIHSSAFHSDISLSYEATEIKKKV